MPVTLNPTEIRHRAHHFSKEFADAHYELGEAQPDDYPLQPSPHWSFNGQSLKALYEAVHDGGE